MATQEDELLRKFIRDGFSSPSTRQLTIDYLGTNFRYYESEAGQLWLLSERRLLTQAEEVRRQNHQKEMNNRPWLPYLVTEYIEHLCPTSVFEWGSGGSTLFFASLGANIVSIEHDADWYDKIKDALWRDGWEVDYHLIPPDLGEIGPDKADPGHYKSGSTLLGAVNFKSYASIIDNYGLFDLILIDGKARPSCLAHAISHVKPGGCIILDNTGDRPYYLEKTGELFGNYESGWERIRFMGYGPILDYQWETTVFINRRKADYETGKNNQ